MILKKVIVNNFRNFDNKEFFFSPTLTVIYGENARGKTNLLEAIYCLSYGVGFRETKEEELIRINQTKARISGLFVDNNQEIELMINFDNKGNRLEKKYYLNKVNKKLKQFLNETTNSILFSPQQLEIITGSPEDRRQYFDKLISGYDIDYKKRLINYENALRKRNKILESYKTEKNLKEELFFWDDYLEDQASYINKKRTEYINYLNQNPKIDDKKFSIKYLASELTRRRLKEFFSREKQYRRTLIGPQKDDFQIQVVENSYQKNLHLFGSRSEHRLGIFWLKLNEIRYYEKHFKKKPTLLLDDIFSELDLGNKKLILALIKEYQTILTTADPEILKLSLRSKVIIRL